MVRKTRRAAVRQPRHRNHRSPHPLGRKAGDYDIGVDQNVTPACRTSKIGEMGGFLLVYRRVVAHWRAIVLLLILGFVAFIVAPFDEFVPFMLILFALLLLFIASQIFWIGRILDLGERFIPGKPRRAWLAIMAPLGSSFLFPSIFPHWAPGRSCPPAHGPPA